ncbi:MAG: class I SAM-dependent methyltransferase [Planctomycetes bacterium]|nr:class I SAM-dependent methyltransferase [Planctomycetota bacterium]
MTSKSLLRAAILSAYREVGPDLGREVTDEMAVPAYLQGIALSRYVFWRKLHCVIRAAKLVPNSRVFDFGCGTGILLPQLAAAGRSVVATDLHPLMARNVIKQLRLSRVTLVPADQWPDSIPDGEIETVIAANVLEHIDERRELLQVLGRKLTPTGRLVISGPTENRLYRLGRRIVGFSGRYHVTNIHDIVADARAVGLRQVYRRRWPAPGPLSLYHIAAFELPDAGRR